MPKRLRALFVEDSDHDAQLLLRELEQSGYEVMYERVETGAAMEEALFRQTWDIIICDYSLPQFGALAALVTLKESGIDIHNRTNTCFCHSCGKSNCMRFADSDIKKSIGELLAYLF